MSSRSKCQCYKSLKELNKPCPFDALPRSKYCGNHHNCKIIFGQPIKSIKTLRQKTQTPEFLDDVILEHICQEYINNEDWESLTAMIKTHKRGRKVCQPLLDQILSSLSTTGFIEILNPEIDSLDPSQWMFWELGQDLDWTKIKSPNHIILGKGSFVIKVPNLNSTKKYEELIIQGPLTQRKIVTIINQYYKQLLKVDPNISHWVGMNDIPWGLTLVDSVLSRGRTVYDLSFWNK
jgi:hypothetical protein